MTDIQASYQNASSDDPQAKVQTDSFSLNQGEALVIIYIKRPDGTVEMRFQGTYGADDLSSYNNDPHLIGYHVMQAIEEANK